MSLASTDPDFHKALALFQARRLTEAGAAFAAWCAAHPDDARAWSTLGIIHGMQGQWKEAEAGCRRAIAADPAFGEAHVNLGVVLEARGEPDAALASYREALRLDPAAGIHHNIGVLLRSLGRCAEAIEHFHAAVALAPGDPEIRVALGAAYQAQGRFAEAETAYREALGIAPDSFDAELNMGNLLLSRARQRFSETQTEHEQACLLKPLEDNTSGDPGVAPGALGMFEEVEASFRRAVQLNRGHAGAHNNLGIAQAALGRYEEATASFERALQLNPGHAGARSNLEQLTARRGRFFGGSEGSYQDWIARYEAPDLDPGRYAARIAALARRPLISVVMPVYNPHPRWLEEAIGSVQAQYYPEWELCIADDASTDPAIRPLLERLAAEDARIRVVFRKTNGHICAASNSALDLARGELVALLDHDDLLAPHALYWVARELFEHPEVNLVYSDEDKIDARGERYSHYFKPGWNPDLLGSHNFISHLGAYRTALLKQLGGFRPGFEGSQDYDLAWRVVDESAPGQIRHIPRILYHWRAHRESAAGSVSAKPYAADAAMAAIRDHLARAGRVATVTELPFGFRVRYALPQPTPLVSIIIPVRNRPDLLRWCIASICEKTAYPNYEILVVDHGSDDPRTLEYQGTLERERTARMLRIASPFNFSALCNEGAAAARGEVLALVHSDVEVISADWLDEMASQALRPDIGAVGARLLYSDGRVQHAGLFMAAGMVHHAHRDHDRSSTGYCGRARLIQNYSAVSAACLVVEKRKHLEVGGLDETLAMEMSDVDFCLRLDRKGYRSLWTPFAELYHLQPAAAGGDSPRRHIAHAAGEVALMRERWGARLETDPAYNPNLTSVREDWSLAWPPRLREIDGLIGDAPDLPGHRAADA